MMASTPAPVALIIMDGLALNPSDKGNAVKAARTPNLDTYMETYPWSRLGAGGRDVRLMEGQMGDSNVGHLNIGAGRVVKQYVLRILDSIDDGSFFENKALIDAVDGAKERGTPVHIMGLLSPGGVHGHMRIVEALIKLAIDRGIEQVYIHAFTDGRDVPPKSGLEQLSAFEHSLPPQAKVATVSGRYFAMDRDRRWDRTQRAYRAIVRAIGEHAPSAAAAMADAYDRGESDEFVSPTVIVDESGGPVAPLEDGATILFANFRADRARQIVRALIEDSFEEFDRGSDTPKVHVTSMTQYDPTLDVPFAFAAQDMRNILGEVVAAQGWKQLRVAETEKYAHVTFFFNGGLEEPFPGEVRRLIPSPKVATYDLQPEMSADEVAQAALDGLAEDEFQFLVVNFANCDMVGHTGDFDAAVRAVETVDTCVKRVVDAVHARGGSALVTADHGNADQMIDEATGGPHTFHTLHPVPCILISADKTLQLSDGRLADLAPTLLELLGVAKPKEMDGRSLIRRNG